MISNALDGTRVLLVEDNQMFSTALGLLFEDEGMILVKTCRAVKEAVDAARTELLDVALLDVNIAGESVFPVAEILIERNVPFIFLTGYGESRMPPSFRNRPAFCKTSAPRTVLDAIAASCASRNGPLQ